MNFPITDNNINDTMDSSRRSRNDSCISSVSQAHSDLTIPDPTFDFDASLDPSTLLDLPARKMDTFESCLTPAAHNYRKEVSLLILNRVLNRAAQRDALSAGQTPRPPDTDDIVSSTEQQHAHGPMDGDIG